MSEAQFWDMNPRKLKPYIEADRMRLENRNFELWLQGAYFYDALAAVAANALSTKRRKVAEYPKEPKRITPYTPEEKEAIAKREREKAIAFFKNMERTYRQEGGE